MTCITKRRQRTGFNGDGKWTLRNASNRLLHIGRALRRMVRAFTHPIPKEMRRLLSTRWAELPLELKTDCQVLGRHLVHCGYTLGAAYCSFGCTHCYLPKNASRTPIPSLHEMKSQIDANRRLIGPGGGLQITGGDVVDAYWRAAKHDELVEIIRYANAVGVVPMLMTHGQRLLDHPDYLRRLIVEGGLRKLGIHIDITQAGRPRYPIRTLSREKDLHPLRDAFVDLILGVRRATGVPLSAAQLLTVAERNIDSIPEVLEWMTRDPRHLDVFRTISFQTEAQVGRTRASKHPVSAAQTWQQICAGLHQDLPRGILWYGHPDCTSVTVLMVLFPERRVINLVADDGRGRQFWSTLLDLFGGSGVSGQDPLVSSVRNLSLVLRRPRFVGELLSYIRFRLRQDGLGWEVLWRCLRGQARGFNLVMHNFMEPCELTHPRAEAVEKRLKSCSFRGAVRRGSRWVAEPMCSMNIEHRESLYARQIARANDRGSRAHATKGIHP